MGSRVFALHWVPPMWEEPGEGAQGSPFSPRDLWGLGSESGWAGFELLRRTRTQLEIQGSDRNWARASVWGSKVNGVLTRAESALHLVFRRGHGALSVSGSW